jgi:hypothetical protein
MKGLLKYLIVMMLVAGMTTISSAMPNWEDLPRPPAQGSVTDISVIKGGDFEYWCNGVEPIDIDISVTTDVEQWLFIHWEPTYIDWEIRKPGEYKTNCLHSLIESNGDVLLSLTNMCPGDPDPIHKFALTSRWFGEGEPPDDPMVNGEIPEGYEILLDWVPPGEEGYLELPGCERHIVKLWDKVFVDFHTEPGTYYCRAVVTIIKQD